MGFKYSSSKIAPGVMGVFMVITCSVIGKLSMVIRDANFRRSLFGPSEYNVPLWVDPNGMVVELFCTETECSRIQLRG